MAATDFSVRDFQHRKTGLHSCALYERHSRLSGVDPLDGEFKSLWLHDCRATSALKRLRLKLVPKLFSAPRAVMIRQLVRVSGLRETSSALARLAMGVRAHRCAWRLQCYRANVWHLQHPAPSLGPGSPPLKLDAGTTA
ncbi:hypothetical protein DPEC_G00364700 [Dallia pectoralis]|nr:hypothetical protein DPEC_G00364700 [Dallia pectoralis]